MTPRQLWVAALRSGEFVQGKNTLETCNGEFCCLGVGCIVYERATGNKLERYSSGHLTGGLLMREDEVCKWLGLSTGSGHFTAADGERTDLTTLNDHKENTFEEIADIIESEPKGLFDEHSS